jgi:hypothetical protein
MAANDTIDGWGVVGPAGLNVRTISDTRRAAIVNWLVTDAHILLLQSHTDDDIERLWNEYREDATVERVKIAVLRH